MHVLRAPSRDLLRDVLLCTLVPAPCRPVRANLAPPLAALIPKTMHSELAGKKIFCLAGGGPSAAVGRQRYVKMSDGCVGRPWGPG